MFFDLRQTPGHITTLGALPFPHSRVREECREFISDRFGRLEMIAEHLLELSTHVTTTIEARCCNRVVRVWVCVCLRLCRFTCALGFSDDVASLILVSALRPPSTDEARHYCSRLCVKRVFIDLCPASSG